MNFNDIERAVGERLLTVSPTPAVAWPNKAYSGATPYVEFRHVPNGIENQTIDGLFQRAEGIFLLTVVVDSDQFTRPANTIAQAIIAAFGIGLRLPLAGGGAIVLNQSSDVAPGFVDGVFYRTPVRVFYVTSP